MAIRTQRFTPLQHRHYQLAETQGEKDEAMRRQMVLQNNQAANQAMLQNARLNQEAQSTNARILAGERRAGERVDQDMFNRQMTLELAERQREQDAYRQSMDDKELSRQERLDTERSAQYQEQSALRNLQMDDARLKIDAKKQAKELTEKTMALGEVGRFLSLMPPDDNGEVNITPIAESFAKIIPGFKPGKNVVMRNTGDFAELYEKEGDNYTAVMMNGSPVRINNQVLMQTGDVFGIQNKEPTKAEQEAFKYAASSGKDIDNQLSKVEKELFDLENQAALIGGEPSEAQKRRMQQLQATRKDLASQAIKLRSTIDLYQERFNPFMRGQKQALGGQQQPSLSATQAEAEQVVDYDRLLAQTAAIDDQGQTWQGRRGRYGRNRKPESEEAPLSERDLELKEGLRFGMPAREFSSLPIEEQRRLFNEHANKSGGAQQVGALLFGIPAREFRSLPIQEQRRIMARYQQRQQR